MANESKGGKPPLRGKQAKNSTTPPKKAKLTEVKNKMAAAKKAKKDELKEKNAKNATKKTRAAVAKSPLKKSPKSALAPIKKAKKTAKPEAYKNRHNIGRRAAGRVHSYKETDYAVVYPDGYWEDLIKSEASKLAAAGGHKEEDDEEEEEEKQATSRKRRSTDSTVDEPVKKSKKKEEPKKTTPKKKDKAKPKEVSPPSEDEEEEEEEEEGEEEEEVAKPRKPRFADIKPRAPRIKRTACLNANAIVSLMYERDEPLKKQKVEVTDDEGDEGEGEEDDEEEATDSESLDWEVSFPKWKPKNGRSTSPPSAGSKAEKGKKKAQKSEEKKGKKSENGVDFSPWSPPRRMASLNAQAILTACMDERTKKPKAEAPTKETPKEAPEPTKAKKKEEVSKKTAKAAVIKTERLSTPAPPSTSSSDSTQESRKSKPANKSPEVQIVEIKKSPSSTPLPPSQTFRPSYIPPLQSSIHSPGQLYPHEYMRYPHGAPPHARTLGTQTSFPLPPSSQRHYPQHTYTYAAGSPSPYPPQHQYNRDLWATHYGRGERLPFAPQYKDGRLPLRYPTPPPPQSPFQQQPQQPYPYPTASNVYMPPTQHYQAFPMEQQQPQQAVPPKARPPPPQRHCLAPPMPQPPQHHHHHHHQAPPKPSFQSPPNSFPGNSSRSSSLPSSSSASSSSNNNTPTNKPSQAKLSTKGSPQKDETKILYNSGGSKFHTQPEIKGPNNINPSLPASSSAAPPSSQATIAQPNVSNQLTVSEAHSRTEGSRPVTVCGTPSTTSMVMAVCATGAKNANGAPVGGCSSYTNATLQNNSNCQPFMLSTISAEGAFPIVPFQQYGTSAFAVPSFEDQQRLTFGYYQPAGPLIQTMPGESVFLQHPMGLQSLHHPQVKVLVHNTGFVPSGVCQAAEIGSDSDVVKPVTLAIPMDKAMVKTDLSPVKKSESLPHLVPIAPKRAAPVAIAPRPAAMVTNVTTVLTQPQPTSAVQIVKPQNKKATGKTAKAPATSQPKTDPPSPPPSTVSSSSSSSSSSQTTASSPSSSASSSPSLLIPTNCSTAAKASSPDVISRSTTKRRSTGDKPLKKETTSPIEKSFKKPKSAPVTPVVTVTIDRAKPPVKETTLISKALPPLVVSVPADDHLPLRRTSPRLASPNTTTITSVSPPLIKTKVTPKRQKSLTPPPSPKTAKKEQTPSPKIRKKELIRLKQPCCASRNLRASPTAKVDDYPRLKKDFDPKRSLSVEATKFPNPKKAVSKKSMWVWNDQGQISSAEGQKSYVSIRHKIDGDIIRKRDCVLVKSGPRKKDIPFVAKICSLWEKEGEMFMSVFWYYRPEHTETDKLPRCISCEVFASKHRDVIPVNCIEDKCYVLTLNEYCRYRAELKRLEDHCPPRPPLVQAVDSPADLKPNRLPNTGVDPESVFLCRKVYDVKLKRVLKNPQIHSSP